MLEQTVDDALSDFPQHGRDRNHLIAHLIRALESDANWVELYGITGELKVPAFDDDSAAKEILFRIREVGTQLLHEETDTYHSADAGKGQAYRCEKWSLARDPHSSRRTTYECKFQSLMPLARLRFLTLVVTHADTCRRAITHYSDTGVNKSIASAICRTAYSSFVIYSYLLPLGRKTGRGSSIVSNAI